jgi:DNA-binding transcriptional MerR regulator
MRIGDLSRRTGVNAATLRAWERRYGLPRPTRSQGGHRVYDEHAVASVRAVAALVDAGTRVSEAVERVSSPTADAVRETVAADAVRGLWEAVDAFDEQAAGAVLSGVTASLGVPAALDAVLVPTLQRLGAEWRLSPRNIAREHFASARIRAHLVSLLPADGEGPARGLAFCPEGEQHDIGLLMAAVTLAATGRPQVVLGANTPLASIELLFRELRPSLVLVAAAIRRPAVRFLGVWRPPARCRVLAGGAGFRREDAIRLGGKVFHGPYAELPAAVAVRRRVTQRP